MNQFDPKLIKTNLPKIASELSDLVVDDQVAGEWFHGEITRPIFESFDIRQTPVIHESE